MIFDFFKKTHYLLTLKTKSLEFYGILIVFLYAVFATRGITVAWCLFPLILYKYLNSKESNLKNQILLYSKLFVVIFMLNFFAVFDFSEIGLTLPHPDYHFYAKVAYNFNVFGVENYLNAKHYLLEKTNFCVPYRFLDTWILALLFKISPLSDLETMQFFFRPILYTSVSYIFYSTFKDYYQNRVLLFFSAIFINFFMSDFFTHFILTLHTDTISSIASYPKLWIYFIVFIKVIHSLYTNGWNSSSSILTLCFLPVLIQTTFHLYLVVVLWLLFSFKFYKKDKVLIFCIFSSIIYYVCFYILNGYKQSLFFKVSQVNTVSDVYTYVKRFLSLWKEVFFSGGLLFLCYIVVICSRCKVTNIGLYISLFSFIVLSSGVAISAFLPMTPNSYQFYLNLVAPVFISILIVVFVVEKFGFDLKKYILLFMSILGFFNLQFGKSNFYKYRAADKLNPSEIEKIVNCLKTVDNPIGLTYYKNYEDNFSEHFDQKGTSVLLYSSARHDVVNLKILELRPRTKNDTISYSNSAIILWKHQRDISSQTDNSKDFLDFYKFSYLFTNYPLDSLPLNLREKIIINSEISFNNTKFYLLK